MEKRILELVRELPRPSIGRQFEFPIFIRSLLLAFDLDVNGCFVEIGAAGGRGTISILSFLKKYGLNSTLYSIDPNRAPDWEENVKPYTGSGWPEVVCVDLPSQDREALAKVPDPIAWIFIDGCHCFDCAITDFDFWCPRLPPDGIMVAHDVVWRKSYFKMDFCAHNADKQRYGVAPALMGAIGLQDFHLVERMPDFGGKDEKGMAIFRRSKAMEGIVPWRHQFVMTDAKHGWYLEAVDKISRCEGY